MACLTCGGSEVSDGCCTRCGTILPGDETPEFAAGAVGDTDANRLPPAPSAPFSDSSSPRPNWRCAVGRFLARLIDNSTWGMAAGLAIGLGGFDPTEIFGKSKGIAGMVLIMSWIPLEAVLLSTTGTTLGKWLFHINVRTPDGLKVGLWQALRRSFLVAVWGEAIGIPLIYWVAGLREGNRLLGEGATFWDTECRSVTTHGRMGWIRILCIILILCLKAWLLVGSG